ATSDKGFAVAIAIPRLFAFLVMRRRFVTSMRFVPIDLWRQWNAVWILPLLLWGRPTAVVAQNTSGQYSYYITEDRMVILTGYNGPGGTVTIPSVIDGMPVTAIAFASTGNTNVTSITIPETVTGINYRAFADWTRLMTVAFPYSLKSIDE